MPRVSVIMPAYNAERYIQESIDSILNQTFTDFELIIIDDGSKDGTAEVIRSYKDKRLSFYQNENNMGVAETLNRGLTIAKGEYIARLDSDDIAMPDRFEKQVAFLDAHPDISVCGSNASIIPAQTQTQTYVPISDTEIKYNMFIASPFLHSSIMMRKENIDKYNLHYEKQYEGEEDYRLWMQFSLNGGRFYNFPECLIKYRIHENQVTNQKSFDNIAKDRNIRELYLKECEIDYTNAEIDAVMKKVAGEQFINKKELEDLKALFTKIINKNNDTMPKVFVSILFSEAMNVYNNIFNSMYLVKDLSYAARISWFIRCTKAKVKQLLVRK